jgi:hypothetical protein
MNPTKCHFEEKFDFLSQKMTFLRNLLDFHKYANLQNILNPSTPGMTLAAPRSLKIIENGP